MKPALRVLSCLSLLLIACNARAQSEHGNDDPSVTTNLGIPFIVALNPTGRFISGGWGVDSKVGYNFDRRNALIGEFMWNTLNPTNAVLQPIRVALQSPNITGSSNLYALTQTTDSNCEIVGSVRISSAAAGITVTRAFRNRFPQAPTSPATPRGFGGDLTARRASKLPTSCWLSRTQMLSAPTEASASPSGWVKLAIGSTLSGAITMLRRGM
jgi:hypothetical protein